MVAASSSPAAALTWDQADVVIAATAGLVLLTGLAVILRRSKGANPNRSPIRSWITLALGTGLVLLGGVTFAVHDPALQSTAAGALIATAGSAIAFYLYSKTAGPEQPPELPAESQPQLTRERSLRRRYAVASGVAFAVGAAGGVATFLATAVPLEAVFVGGSILAASGLALNGTVAMRERRVLSGRVLGALASNLADRLGGKAPDSWADAAVGDTSDGEVYGYDSYDDGSDDGEEEGWYRGVSGGGPPGGGPVADLGSGTRTEPPRLFWNTLFPDNQAILLNQPHLVVAQAEYRLETVLGPEAVRGAAISEQEAARLLDKEIRYRLEAENGEFRVEDSGTWDIKAVSASMTCTETGTDAFRVWYRARQAGRAVISAELSVNGGSVDEQEIELQAVGGQPAAGTIPLTRVSAGPGAGGAFGEQRAQPRLQADDPRI